MSSYRGLNALIRKFIDRELFERKNVFSGCCPLLIKLLKSRYPWGNNQEGEANYEMIEKKLDW